MEFLQNEGGVIRKQEDQSQSKAQVSKSSLREEN
jgi:hypothetical protein